MEEELGSSSYSSIVRDVESFPYRETEEEEEEEGEEGEEREEGYERGERRRRCKLQTLNAAVERERERERALPHKYCNDKE